MPPPLYTHDPFLALHRALQHPWLDLPAALLSTACEGWALALLGLVAIALLEEDGRRFAAVYVPLAAALAVSGFAVQELKELFATPRPLAIYGAGAVRIGLEPLYQLGFPSGHSSAGAVFATYLTLAYGRRTWWSCAVALLGGVSRVYVGAHWVTDVIGGWAFGATLAAIAFAVAAWASPDGRLALARRRREAPRSSAAKSAPEPRDGVAERSLTR